MAHRAPRPLPVAIPPLTRMEESGASGDAASGTGKVTTISKQESKIKVAEALARLCQDRLDARAVALGGSVATGAADASSDIDLYVYADPISTVAERNALAETFGASPGAEIGNTFFEPGDDWHHAETGIDVDIMYRTPGEIEERLDAVLLRHEPSLGYTTCFWHNVLTSRCLVDRDGWYAALQVRASAPYPEPLRRAIVQHNWSMLALTTNSWLAQLKSAVGRDDRVSAGHRTSALLGSYFDILFAINRQPHPGEKRLLALASRLCPERPANMENGVLAILEAAGRAEATTCSAADELAEGIAPLVADVIGKV